jgi:hypothetical protein
VLYLREAADVDYDRLAEHEQVSHKALKSLLCRARAQFRSQYARLLEESAAALGLVRSLAPRLRARLADNSAAGWERVGGVAGMALVAGIMGVLSMPGSTAPASARSGPGLVAGRAVDDAVSAPAGADELPGGDGRAATTAGADGAALVGPAGGSDPRDGGPGAGAPLSIDAGGGLTHGPESEKASVWIGVDDPVSGRTVGAGTEARCDAGKVYAAECTVLRAVPTDGED